MTRSLLVLMLVIAGTFLVADQFAEREALRDARAEASAIADAFALRVGHATRSADPTSSAAELRELFAREARKGPLRHVKMWSPTGEVLWADEQQLVGRRYPLLRSVRALFGTDRVVASVSELDRAENVAEADEEDSLEVYVGTWDASGAPVVFEAYLDTTQIGALRTAIRWTVLPVSTIGLVLLLLLMLPLAVALARRVEREQRRQSAMVRHALLASDLERRRMVQDLHDGVIQDLAGLTYALPSVTTRLPEGPEHAQARSTAARIHETLLSSVAALRRLLTDSYPPNLRETAVVSAVADLAANLAGDTLEVEVRAPADLRLPEEVARLAYRVAREGLRNVIRHAEASHVLVQLDDEARGVVVRVVDDGRGLTGGGRKDSFGLRLLEDTLADLDGELTLSTTEGGGTTLQAVIPHRLS